MKKAFTLMEIVIVVFLIGIMYALLFSNFNIPKEKKIKLSIENIKGFMLSNFPYENELSLTCVEDEEFSCYVFVDKNIKDDIKITSLFKELPSVYKFNKQLESKEFKRVRINNQDEKIFFQLKFDGDRKHEDMIVDMNDNSVYVFNSLFKDVKKYESINEVVDNFYENETEVKDAI